MGHRELPSRDQLRDYDHAVAGHAGTLCDADGELFIKPCTQSEIDFYQSARRHRDFAELMPVFMGSLVLSDPEDGVDEAVAGVISDAGLVEVAKEHLVQASESVSKLPAEPQADQNIAWTSSKGKRIKTDTAVVLENAAYGFKKANILDVKLGVRLWADDAPLEKKRRFDKISSETTHADLGLRIAGMKVYRGSQDPSELDKEGYRIYDKDYGRVSVNSNNVVDEFRKFIFNKAAGIDDDTGKAVCKAFARDLAHVCDVMERHETRMYSTSLLFVFEGDGDALRIAIEEHNSLAESLASDEHNLVESAAIEAVLDRAAKRDDSGIGLCDSEDDDLREEPALSVPPLYTLQLIDFAHAQWTPGLGPDENILKGVRSLERIFKEMAE